MKSLRPTNEDEMIATFLAAEVDSSRFGKKLRAALASLAVDEELIRSPNTADSDANRARRELLTAYRGWGQVESVFGGMPDDIQWVWAELDQDALENRVYTISWYFEETFGTRRAAEIAASKQGRSAGTKLGNSGMPPPPILLTDSSMNRLVILEGHSRIISYLVEPSAVVFPIMAIVGISPRIMEWSEW